MERDLPPRRVGRYEPVISIGAGGMATVYLARAPLADGVSRQVALKVVHPHLRESEDAARTLIEEAKLAARIRHPNVVAVHEVGEDSAGIFLVMDYIEGATLSALVRAQARRGESVPLPIAGRILLDALAGLHAAHELVTEQGSALGLVHRDFSPVNVLVGVDGVTRLTDFGIAKAATRHAFTSTGVVKGKLGYLSPEQALGQPLDRRSDVWAAGVVAWELLSGRRLIQSGDEPVAAMLRIVSETPPRLRSVRPELSPVIEQAVAMALTLDPNRRWPSAREFALALGSAWRALGIAEPEQVGDYVIRMVGDELEARREAVRRATPKAVTQPERRQPRSRLWLALALALPAAVALAALALVGPSSAQSTPPSAPLIVAPVAEQPIVAEPELAVASSQPPADGGGRSAEPPAPARFFRRARAERKPSLGPNPYRKP